MGYENSAACKIMATNCCACGKPLVDAKSVETGMGPVCRGKYGYNADVPDRVRTLANVWVHRLACDVSYNTVTMDSMALSAQLRDLGFAKIADIFEFRMVKIAVTVDDFDGEARYFVRSPYDGSGGFNHDVWSKGRQGVKVPALKAPTAKKVFHWTFPKTEEARKRIFAALLKHHEGSLAFAPDGSVFEIKPLQTAAQKAAEATKEAA